jgi:hypothetical protein
MGQSPGLASLHPVARAGNGHEVFRGFAHFEGICSLFINEMDEKVFTVRQAKLALSNR